MNYYFGLQSEVLSETFLLAELARKADMKQPTEIATNVQDARSFGRSPAAFPPERS